ncbi:MAG: sulfurtransferase [Pseudomonadota bacterium]|nr:sulfurtransferase [Pseudomonadota bacterium]
MVFQSLIDVDALRDLLGKPRVAILDCRFDLMDLKAGRQAYLTGHIPGARHADLHRDLSAPVSAFSSRHPLPTPEFFASRLSRLGVSDADQVVAYDAADGSFAARLWWMLRWLGHASVAVLDGGFKAWSAAGGAVESGDLPPGRNQFLPRAAASGQALIVSTAAVIEALRDPQTTLADARAAERFDGTVEPIDPVAGHVPGAVNHPFTQNLDASGRFLPAAQLRERWQERLAGRSPRNLIAMCGSGVTACHNLLSLEVAGLSGAKLYAGSWSEWIRDPRRPIAKS